MDSLQQTQISRTPTNSNPSDGNSHGSGGERSHTINGAEAGDVATAGSGSVWSGSSGRVGTNVGDFHVVAVGTAPKASDQAATSTNTALPVRRSNPDAGSFLVKNRASVPNQAEKAAERRRFGWAARRYNHQKFSDRRFGKCARVPLTRDVVVKRTGDGAVHTSGLMQCGSIHACPPCAAKIRAQRAEEIGHKAAAHLTAGGGLAFLTVTLPHELADNLADLWDVVADSWSRVIGGSPFHGGKQKVGAKERFGIVGFIRAFDLTHGDAGWHPHLHILVFTNKPLTELDDEFWDLRTWFHRRWAKRIHALLNREVSAGFGVELRSVKNDTGIGTYISKVNLEMARGDLKTGRNGGRTPFQILKDAIDHNRDADHRLWAEYVTASKGRQLITCTSHLKHLYPTDELTDEEIASAEQEGTVELFIDRHLWRRFLDHEGLVNKILVAHQEHGFYHAYHIANQAIGGLWLQISGDIPRITTKPKNLRRTTL